MDFIVTAVYVYRLKYTCIQFFLPLDFYLNFSLLIVTIMINIVIIIIIYHKNRVQICSLRQMVTINNSTYYYYYYFYYYQQVELGYGHYVPHGSYTCTLFLLLSSCLD